ncbi:UNVERIFIED_CONTAM: hypothetical protein PYX00_011610 [Menopon gallinae]|uniref:Uncharacterized protein n=1 Tax=Menopon gallinae TaxID=328185 RepID=A0AAW2H8S4_9NEOP
MLSAHPPGEENCLLQFLHLSVESALPEQAEPAVGLAQGCKVRGGDALSAGRAGHARPGGRGCWPEIEGAADRTAGPARQRLICARARRAMGVNYTVHDGERSLEDELARDSTLVPVYLHVAKEAGVTRLSLSRERGRMLYCVSSCKHGNLLEYFSIAGEKSGRAKEAEVLGHQETTKRAKQSNLLSFVNQK